jgi:thiopurine S-methyltransferase
MCMIIWGAEHYKYGLPIMFNQIPNNYWISAWKSNKIKFHQKAINQNLISYFDDLNLKNNSKILVPLCGKTSDILWLSQQGFHVTGIEISHIACQDFFQDNKLDFCVTKGKDFSSYQHDNIELLCGNIFDINLKRKFQAIYDRAALVAIHPSLRKDYVNFLIKVSSKNSRILLVVFESEHNPVIPPFPIAEDEIKQLFHENFTVLQLSRNEIKKLPAVMIKNGHKKIFFSTYLLIKKE